MAVVGCVGCVAWAEETALLLLFRLHLCIQTAQKKNLCPQLPDNFLEGRGVDTTKYPDGPLVYYLFN